MFVYLCNYSFPTLQLDVLSVEWRKLKKYAILSNNDGYYGITIRFCKSYIVLGKATFCLNGFVNRHNCRYKSVENAHWIEEFHLQKLNI